MGLLKILIIGLLLLCCNAFPLCAQKNEIRVLTGYGNSNLHWSIAGNTDGKNPDILSELAWSRLRGTVWNAGLRYSFNKKWGLELGAGYHHITKGRVTDKDYAQDNRQGNYYNEEFNSQGKALTADAVLQYHIGNLSGFQIRPFVGYTLQKQEALLLGDEDWERDLHSSYKTTWMGAQAGVNASRTFNRLDLRIDLATGLLAYRAAALWNLIDKFAKPVSFRHYTEAYQLKGNVEIGYTLGARLRIMGYCRMAHADAWKGTDRAYYSDGSTIDTRLNWVTTTTTAFGAGLGYLF
ncbi:MAG: outer membrane beta-barrel protein [Niabella sp.]|nr:outer membrane beta-barrel protein [Niabella sp.]